MEEEGKEEEIIKVGGGVEEELEGEMESGHGHISLYSCMEEFFQFFFYLKNKTRNTLLQFKF